MNVWVVLEGVQWEGSWVIGVFDSKSGATAFKDQHELTGNYEYDIEMWKINSTDRVVL